MSRFFVPNNLQTFLDFFRTVPEQFPIFPRTFPSGQSVEIIRTNTLGKNIKFFSRQDKEHVTRYFYRNSSKFRIKNFVNKKKTSIKKLSIDTIDDLKKILKHFKKKKFLNYSYLNEKN